MLKILYSKFLRYIDDHTFGELMQTLAKFFCWLVISISLFNIPEARENFTTAIKWADFAILKIIGSFIIVFHIKSIINTGKIFFSWMIDGFRELSGNSGEVTTYQNIPLTELVDYFFSADTFARSDFCSRFAVSRKVFDDLADGFDRIGVFIRGKNNARVLNDEYSRSDIASILTRAIETREIRTLIREVKGGYTHSPSHGFTTRSLHGDNPLAV